MQNTGRAPREVGEGAALYSCILSQLVMAEEPSAHLGANQACIQGA